MKKSILICKSIFELWTQDSNGEKKEEKNAVPWGIKIQDLKCNTELQMYLWSCRKWCLYVGLVIRYESGVPWAKIMFLQTFMFFFVSWKLQIAKSINRVSDSVIEKIFLSRMSATATIKMFYVFSFQTEFHKFHPHSRWLFVAKFSFIRPPTCHKCSEISSRFDRKYNISRRAFYMST